MLRSVARRACSTEAALLDVKLHAWKATQDSVAEAAASTQEAVERHLKAGNGGVIRCAGAKSVNAVLRGMAKAEETLSGPSSSMWGGESKIACTVQANPQDYHTFRVSFTAAGHKFPQDARVIDVVDKFELQEDMYEHSVTSPSSFYNDSELELPFDKNSPMWRKQWQASARELVALLVQHRHHEALVRGMGPSIFNSLKAIHHAQEALEQPLVFGLRRIAEDDATIAVFKDDMKEYFERGLVFFRDRSRLPGSRADGKLFTVPETYEDTDYFTISFAVKMA